MLLVDLGLLICNKRFETFQSKSIKRYALIGASNLFMIH
jgi:hypothetical protein